MPRDERHEVGAEQAGLRLDQILASLPSIGSRGKARRALSSGKVQVDGSPVGPEQGGEACTEGSVVEVAWNRPGTAHHRNASRKRLRTAGVQVLFEDALLLGLDKPAGLLTDAATRAQRRDEDTLTARARGWCGRGDVWPVHRIDRDTTGVVLFAKGAEARAHLKGQWEGQKPRRVYVAILMGRVEADEGTWAHWMRWNRGDRRQEPCRPGADGGVLARSHFRVTQRLAGATVVEVELDTGRRNQIRLSACLAGHPLVGERFYVQERVEKRGGERRKNKRKGPSSSLARQALHNRMLVVKHPGTGEQLTLTAPLAADLARWIAQRTTTS